MRSAEGDPGSSAEVLERMEQLSAELRRSNEDLQRFASTVAHDLREPMRTITSFLGLVARELGDDLPPRVDKFMGHIHDASARMTGMIDGLLTWSRVETEGREPVPVALAPVIDDVLASLGTLLRQSGVRVEIDALPMIHGDEAQLGQVLQNLVQNAIKFRSAEDPRIRISSAPVEGSEPPMIELCVADNGIGVPEDARDRVFELFRRLHTRDAFEGMGVGLTVCRRIVERHGGTIRLTDTPGGGTTVHLTLPAER